MFGMAVTHTPLHCQLTPPLKVKRSVRKMSTEVCIVHLDYVMEAAFPLNLQCITLRCLIFHEDRIGSKGV